MPPRWTRIRLRAALRASPLALVGVTVGVAQALAQSPVATPRSGDAGRTAPIAVPVQPAPGPAQPGKPPQQAQWPRILGEPKASTTEWSREEIEAARAQCDTLLAGTGAVAVPVEPMRSGDCGAPAPIELVSVGSAPQVTFSPPAVVTCEMVAALDRWLKTDVQPAAKSLLGGNIVRIEVMSSYSCRTAYGRRHARLSEHGRANAIDVRSFLTDRGDTVDIQTDWGLTERDIKARIVAAKKEAERQEAARQEAARIEAERLAAAKAKTAREADVRSAGTSPIRPFGEALRGSITDQAAPSLQLPPVLGGGREPSSLGWTPPSQLGGPKGSATPAPTVDPSKPKERFLRRIHTSACQVFGTILGPEANEAHRNHFHIDMAERRSGSYCE